MKLIERALRIVVLVLLAGALGPSAAADLPGGIGPDVLGFRIGMTPDEARGVLRAKVFPTGDFEKTYKEDFRSLAFTISGRPQQEIPNSKYLSWFRLNGFDTDRANKLIQGAFSPEPGRESLVSIKRVEILPPQKHAPFETFRTAMVEKYGPPTRWDPKWPGIFAWHFDAAGELKKPDSVDKPAACLGAQAVVEEEPGWVLGGLLRTPTFEQLPERCGAIVIHVTLGFERAYASPDTMVKQYNTYLIGWGAAVRAVHAATETIEKAKSDAGAAAVREGQKQKPNL
jgi:hypothetical protein